MKKRRRCWLRRHQWRTTRSNLDHWESTPGFDIPDVIDEHQVCDRCGAVRGVLTGTTVQTYRLREVAP